MLALRLLAHQLIGRVPLPRHLIVDPVNRCQLSCPFCPTGSGKAYYPAVMMGPELFSSIIEQIPGLKSLCLFNWGEPLLNPHLGELIRIVQAKRAKTIVHTHFAARHEDQLFQELIESGLTELVVSLDGITQESYGQYRQGGSITAVFDNISRFMNVLRSGSTRDTRLIWKMMVNRHNEQELEQARAMASRWGIELRLVPMGLGDDLPDVGFASTLQERKREWLPQKESKFVMGRYRNNDEKTYCAPKVCEHLFETMTIAPDGRVFPCCFAAAETSVMGDLRIHSVKEVWNNQLFLAARNLFVRSRAVRGGVPVVCSRCSNYQSVREG